MAEVNNLGAPNATRTKTQDRQFRRMQRKLKRVVHKRLKPLPLERLIELTGYDTNTTAITTGKGSASGNSLQVSQVADAVGVPIGVGTLYTNVTLRGCTNGDPRSCNSADVDITVESRSGIIYGRCSKCSYSYHAITEKATIAGEAVFTDGTWGFRDIKAKRLNFTQVDFALVHTNAVTRITGAAWF